MSTFVKNILRIIDYFTGKEIYTSLPQKNPLKCNVRQGITQLFRKDKFVVLYSLRRRASIQFLPQSPENSRPVSHLIIITRDTEEKSELRILDILGREVPCNSIVLDGIVLS